MAEVIKVIDTNVKGGKFKATNNSLSLKVSSINLFVCLVDIHLDEASKTTILPRVIFDKTFGTTKHHEEITLLSANQLNKKLN